MYIWNGHAVLYGQLGSGELGRGYRDRQPQDVAAVPGLRLTVGKDTVEDGSQAAAAAAASAPLTPMEQRKLLVWSALTARECKIASQAGLSAYDRKLYTVLAGR